VAPNKIVILIFFQTLNAKNSITRSFPSGERCQQADRGFSSCAGLPWLAAEGLLLFCLIKKVTKKSRLGTDVG